MFQVPPVLGIDIGTTKVCAAIFQNGQVDVIETETGSRSVPAFVAFTDEEHLVGETAKNQAGSNLDNTIFDIKRVIGRELQEIMPEIQIWPFKFIKETQQVKVQVTYKNEERIFQPEELCALLLVKIKEIAEHQIGHTITDAVISVPALFNENQRVATLCAGKVAGLNVLRLINEPTAAALAYAFDITRPDLHHVVVYDFGASTFDVSVIAVDNNDIKVLSSNGSTKLGGKIIDHRLTQHFLQHIKATEGLDLTNNPRDMYKMMNACEKLKLMLTSAVQARVNFDVSDQELHISMDRGEFEKMNMDLFETSLVYVEQVVMDAKLKKSDISEVILVGGTTRILKIQQLLQDFFPDTSVKKRVNPDEAVACGAAIQAAITRGYEQGISSQDIATFRVMLTDNQIVHSWVLEKNKVIPYDIPAIHPFDGKFYHFFEESADFLLQEHDRSNYLGSFTATRRETRANFSVNESGICTISCKDTVENNQSKAYVKNHLAFAMIEEMSHKVMKIQEDAETRKKILAARYELERYCFKTQSELLKLKKSAKNINTDDLDYALSCISWTNNWVDADVIKPTDQYSVHRKVLEMCITNFLASFNSKVCKPAEIVPKTSTSDQMTFNNDSKSHNTSIVCSSRSFKRSNSDVDLINLQPKKSKSNVCKSLQACKEKLCILTASSTESGRDIQKSDDIINVQTDANKMEYEIQ